MRRAYLLLFLGCSLSGSWAKAQVSLPPTSSIETVAGGKSSSVARSEIIVSSLSGFAGDSEGNIYFSIQARSRVFRLGADGRATAFAGSGVRAGHVEGERAVDSPLFNPASVAIDRANNVYIACADGLLRVDATSHRISTVLVSPFPQREARKSLRGILGMVVGPDGNLYFSDSSDSRIKSYSFATGVVTILAGNGSIGPTQTQVAADSTPLKYPQAVAVGSDGTVYFSTLEPFVFRISPKDGNLQAIRIALPEETAAPGEYDIPSALTLDEQGHLFVVQANRSRILRIELKSGIASVYAGTGQQGFNGDGIQAVLANLMIPQFAVSDASGNLIFSAGDRIRSVASSTGLIQTRLGSSNSLVDDERTMAIHAELWEPANAVAAPDGSLYISSSYTNRLMRLDRNGDLASVAGGGSFVNRGSEAGLAAQVALVYPQGVWLDQNKDVYFSDADNRIVRRFIPDTESVINYATTPKNSIAAGSFLYYAGALISDGKYFFLSDPNEGCVWRISREDGAVELYAGIRADASDTATDDDRRLNSPSGLALDSVGNLYIAEGSLGGRDGRILRVDGATRSITTVSSNLRQPSGLAFQSPGILCFAESGGHQVRCLNLKTGAIRAIAGTGEPGFSGDGGPAECAQLNRPSGISFDHSGELYITDTGNQRIRRVHIGTKPTHCPPQ